MNLSGNTILMTGGASGIGLALAERFARANSTVIVCGRRPTQLAEAKAQCPQLHTFVADVSLESGRLELVARVVSLFPTLNVLINSLKACVSSFAKAPFASLRSPRPQ